MNSSVNFMLCIISFLIGRNFFDIDYNDPIVGRTMAFVSLGMLELIHIFNIRTEQSIFKEKISNKYLIGAFVLGGLLQILVVIVHLMLIHSLEFSSIAFVK